MRSVMLLWEHEYHLLPIEIAYRRNVEAITYLETTDMRFLSVLSVIMNQ